MDTFFNAMANMSTRQILCKYRKYFASSADLDEMPCSVAFHPGIHCLQTYPLRGFGSTKD